MSSAVKNKIIVPMSLLYFIAKILLFPNKKVTPFVMIRPAYFKQLVFVTNSKKNIPARMIRKKKLILYLWLSSL